MSLLPEIIVSKIISKSLDALGAFAQRGTNSYFARRPFRKVMGFGKDDKIYIVVPERPVDEAYAHQSASLMANVHVTFHDMLAANYAERALTLAGVGDERIFIETISSTHRPDAIVTNHLVLICSPKANAYSRAAIESLSQTYGVDLKFELFSTDPDRWQIVFKGAPYPSPTYAEVIELKAKGRSEAEGPLTDFAVLGRIRSPWNPNSRVLLISGLRGIGTWGAARYLRDNTPWLAKQFDGNDFLALIKVSYRELKITDVQVVNHMKLHRAAA